MSFFKLRFFSFPARPVHRTDSKPNVDSPEFGFRLVVYGALVCIVSLGVWIFFGTIDDVVKLRGKVIPRAGIVELQAQTGGTIKYLTVEEGDVVRKGQVLVQLDTEPLHRQLATLEKEKKLAAEQIRKLRITTGNLSQGIEKQNDLLQLEKEIVHTQEMLDTMVVESPFDAVVTSINALQVGNLVTAGKPLVSLVPQNSPFDLEAFAKGTDLQSLKSGLQANVEFDTYPYQTFGTAPGSVLSVSPGTILSEKEPNAFRVLVSLKHSQIANHPVRPGMEATIWVSSEKRTIAQWVWGRLGR